MLKYNRMDKKLVQRTIFPEILAHLGKSEITVIVGPRQTGKTTLVNQLKEKLLSDQKISTEQIFYFNLDVVSDRRIFITQEDFIRFVNNHTFKDRLIYIFVDEAQRIHEAGLFFKGVYDLNLPVKLVLTGSSSLEIKSKIAEPLTGRKKLFTLLPFDFEEYLNFYNPNLISFLSSEDSYSVSKIMEVLYRFMIHGGYPKVSLTTNGVEQEGYLEEIFTSYLEKDVVSLAKIKDQYAFSKFVKIIAQEMGNLFNADKTSQELGIKTETVKRYLDILEKTFVVKRIAPYFKSARAEIRKMPKIYYVDSGLRNYTLEGRGFSEPNFLSRNDKGALLEDFVFCELIKKGINDLNFWRTKDGAEVDFIVPVAGDIIPVEVKAVNLSDGELTRSFVSFVEKYQPKIAVIVNLNTQMVRKLGPTEVHYILPYQIASFLSGNI